MYSAWLNKRVMTIFSLVLYFSVYATFLFAWQEQEGFHEQQTLRFDGEEQSLILGSITVDGLGNVYQDGVFTSGMSMIDSECSASKGLEPGFPVQCVHTAGTYHGGPAVHTLVGNIDADPELEIVVTALSTGPLYAWNHDGTPVSGWPAGPGGVGYAGMGNLSGFSSELEIFSGHWQSPGPSQSIAYDGAGTVLAGWPQDNANYITSPPALADVDNDGFDEIFIAEEDTQLHGYNADGSVLTGWPVYQAIGSQERHTPAIVDLDGDGDLEILSVTGSTTPGVYLLAYHHDGSVVTGYPVLFPKGHVDTYIAIGDVDGDMDMEIILVLRENGFPWRALITVLALDGTIENDWYSTGSVSYGTAPALGDLNGDAVPEIIVQTDSTLDAYFGDGTAVPGFPVTWSGRWIGNSSPVVGDVDGDSYPDIVITTQQAGSSEYGDVRAFDNKGSALKDFPIALNIGSGAMPALADIDLDGRTEIIITGSYWNGITGSYDKVWVYDLMGTNYGPIYWDQLGGNSHHTSVYFSGMVVLYVTGDTLTWTPEAGASGYDVVRGDLNTLLSTGGDFTSATLECLASGIQDVTIDYLPDPPAGEAYWFLVRPISSIAKGTYDSMGTRQIGSRDNEINASPFSCP